MDSAHARGAALLGLFWLALSAHGCAKAPREGPPNLLLISVDTLRADHLGCYGYPLATSPNIDRLAAESTLYADAMAPAAWTLPSHAALLTGVHPWRLGLIDNRLALPQGAPSLAEMLHAGGYQTAAFVDSKPRGYVGAVRGFGRGFDSFRHSPFVRGSLYEHDAAASVDEAIEWLEARRPELPFFLFLHTKSVHTTKRDPRLDNDAPYHKPARYLERFLPGGRLQHSWRIAGKGAGVEYLLDLNQRLAVGLAPVPAMSDDRVRELIALYDAGIYYVDEQLGRLLEQLERLELRRDTVIVLTSDHGEAFLEHRFVVHQEVYQTLLHVPLIVHDPLRSESATVHETVSLEDVAPTLLSLAGLSPPPALEGEPLPRSDDESDAEREHFAYYRWGADYPVQGFTLRDGRYKLVRHRVSGTVLTELYDLERDAGERRPLPPASERERALEERLEARLRAPRQQAEAVQLDPATREQLRALGYAE